MALTQLAKVETYSDTLKDQGFVELSVLQNRAIKLNDSGWLVEVVVNSHIYLLS